MGTTKGTRATTDRSQGKWLRWALPPRLNLASDPSSFSPIRSMHRDTDQWGSKLPCFLFFVCFFGHKAYGIFPDQELNSCPPCWKRRILTTGPPGKSRKLPCYDALGLDPNTAGENSFKRVRISQASPHQSSPLCAHFHCLLAKKVPSSRLTTRPSSEEKRMGKREAMLT